MKKAVVTLRIGDFLPEVWKITKVFQEQWAKKIGAEYIVLTERKFTQLPDIPVNYEKFQLRDIAPDYDYTYFIDADAWVHPDTPDWAEMVGDKSQVLFNGVDNRLNRFKASNYSRRSRSRVGACTWNVICSDWTADLWTPPENVEKAYGNISLQWSEAKTVHCHRNHLIDDYQLSENIARYGLRVNTITNICKEMGAENIFYIHLYNCEPYDKLKAMRERLNEMGIAY